MGVFEDLSSFLEGRLEEFMANNPQLELQALDDNLRDQEDETMRLLADLKLREKKLQDEILATAQEVQRWHERVEKAKRANRLDLAQPAEEREVVLLRQGNQLWGQMEGLKQRTYQTVELQKQIQAKRREVQVKLSEAQVNRSPRSFDTTARQWDSAGWKQPYPPGSAADPLEQAFRKWEMDDEIDQLKRNMGK
ncbi:MAG: TIGR04376 family protein [Kaiparowitsia implicata GSE-PSE-MK54-09C]|nr:TIGR04376 family protein [Kaiparowitsia implicata GSE-PSE-MK54-09C]